MTPRPVSMAALAALVAMVASTAPITAAPRAPHAACLKQATPATISTTVPADYPMMSAEQNVSGTALVRVDLTSTGAVRNAAIAGDAARQQTYSPQVVDCQAVSGSYLIVVDFER
jgi:outer membrane biosynthesis protein TonB